MSGMTSIMLGWLLLANVAAGQVVDWKKLFADLSNPDPLISGAARDSSFHELIPRLETETKSDLDRDIAGISDAFTGSSQIRLQASGLLTGLAVRRQDGAVALKSAFPIYVVLYRDDNPRIRANAVLAVASLQPRAPDELLPGLVELANDPDPQVCQNAILGLVRSSMHSDLARSTTASLLAASQSSPTRLRTLQAIAEARTAAPSLVEIMRKMLGSRERVLAVATIRALGFIGPDAAGARRDLESIANGLNDPELALLATQALSRIGPN